MHIALKGSLETRATQRNSLKLLQFCPKNPNGLLKCLLSALLVARCSHMRQIP